MELFEELIQARQIRVVAGLAVCGELGLEDKDAILSLIEDMAGSLHCSLMKKEEGARVGPNHKGRTDLIARGF